MIGWYIRCADDILSQYFYTTYIMFLWIILNIARVCIQNIVHMVMGVNMDINTKKYIFFPLLGLPSNLFWKRFWHIIT